MRLALATVALVFTNNAWAYDDGKSLVCSGIATYSINYDHSEKERSYSVARDGERIFVGDIAFVISEAAPVYLRALSGPSAQNSDSVMRLELDRLAGDLIIETFWSNQTKFRGFTDTLNYDGKTYYMNERFKGQCRKSEPLL